MESSLEENDLSESLLTTGAVHVLPDDAQETEIDPSYEKRLGPGYFQLSR